MNKAPPARNCDEEMQKVTDYANACVTIAHIVGGLRLLGDSETFWSSRKAWRSFHASLVKRGQEPRWRFPWTSKLAIQLINFALDEYNDHDTALGFLVTYYGLARSGHFDTLLVSDVLAGDWADWMNKVFPAGAQVAYDLYIVRIKCRKRRYQGEMIRVPEYRGLIERATSGRGGDEPLLATWNPRRAIEIMGRFVEASALARLGFATTYTASSAGARRT